MMNFAVKMMNFAVKMMNFIFQNGDLNANIKANPAEAVVHLYQTE